MYNTLLKNLLTNLINVSHFGWLTTWSRPKKNKIRLLMSNMHHNNSKQQLHWAQIINQQQRIVTSYGRWSYQFRHKGRALLTCHLKIYPENESDSRLYIFTFVSKQNRTFPHLQINERRRSDQSSRFGNAIVIPVGLCNKRACGTGSYLRSNIGRKG